MTTCSVEGCEKKQRAKGLCGTHYARTRAAVCKVEGCIGQHYKGGWCSTHWTEERERNRPPCAYEGCMMLARKLGWCETHYRRWQRHRRVDLLPTLTSEERFWSKVDTNGPIPEYAPHLGCCYVWLAGRFGISDKEIILSAGEGYGCFYDEGRSQYAHRWIYERTVGPIPDGLRIDHLCRVRFCVRTSHMEPVTDRVNLLRGVGPPAINAAKTHCKYGHPLSGDNLMRTGADGRGRKCRTCARERALAAYHRTSAHR